MARLSVAQLMAYCQKNGLNYDDLLKKQTPVKAVAITANTEVREDLRNQNEKNYETEMLWPQKLAGLIVDYRSEPINFRIGRGKCWYRPDYMVITDTGSVQIHEVKGEYVREDSLIKFRVASLLYPWFEWHMWQWKDGMWSCIEKH